MSFDRNHQSQTRPAVKQRGQRVLYYHCYKVRRTHSTDDEYDVAQGETTVTQKDWDLNVNTL